MASYKRKYNGPTRTAYKKKRKVTRTQKKRKGKGPNNKAATVQYDMVTTYKSGGLSKAKKRALNFQKKVVKSLQSSLPPNNLMYSSSGTLAIASNTQDQLSAVLFSAAGLAGSSDDISKIYTAVGGLTSAAAGYAYDIYLHHGLLQLDMCIETSSAQVAQCFVDIYTCVCRKDVTASGTTTSGIHYHHRHDFSRELQISC